MTDNEIIRSFGFEYLTELDEWIKPMFEGRLCLWNSINSSSYYYDLSYEDSESFLIPIKTKCSLDDISKILKQLERHIKLSELLENKEDPFPYIIKKSLI